MFEKRFYRHLQSHQELPLQFCFEELEKLRKRSGQASKFIKTRKDVHAAAAGKIAWCLDYRFSPLRWPRLCAVTPRRCAIFTILSTNARRSYCLEARLFAKTFGRVQKEMSWNMFCIFFGYCTKMDSIQMTRFHKTYRHNSDSKNFKSLPGIESGLHIPLQ